MTRCVSDTNQQAKSDQPRLRCSSSFLLGVWWMLACAHEFHISTRTLKRGWQIQLLNKYHRLQKRGAHFLLLHNVNCSASLVCVWVFVRAVRKWTCGVIQSWQVNFQSKISCNWKHIVLKGWWLTEAVDRPVWSLTCSFSFCWFQHHFLFETFYLAY